ncbi:MAG: cytosine permease [Peptococcaceae bacterium]|nr:cytosine permease [Peptococcaceae bacterium]
MAENLEKVPQQTASNQGAYEFAFEPIPEEKKKGGISLFMVLAGYPIALSNFVTGAAIGFRMTFVNAMVAILAADAFLIFVAVMTGIISYETGFSTAFLSRTAFGKKGSSIFSLLLALSAVNWIGINGNTFATMLLTNFPGWPIPVAITGIIVIAIWSQSAIRGYKGLEVISFIGVPAAIILGVACFIGVGIKIGGYGAVLNFVPAEPMTFTAASASVVGSWVFGCIITPDVCRYAKSKATVVKSGISAFFLGLFGLQFVGVLVAQASGSGDFSAATAALGLGYLVFACTIFCLWTTQDNNIYGASLAMQNIFNETKLKGKVTHAQVAIAISALAAVFAAVGALKYLLPIISFLSVLLSPVPALIVAERYFVKNSKMNAEVNPIAIISWILGGICGKVCLELNFFVSPVVSFIFTVIVYTILSKLFDKKAIEN